MKKSILFILLIFSFAVFCFAEEEERIKNTWETNHEPLIKEIRRENTVQGTVNVGTNTFSGIIDSIVRPGYTQGAYTITVVRDGDIRMDFNFTSGINIISEDGKPTSVRGLRSGDKVIVEYAVTKGGINKVSSITLQ